MREEFKQAPGGGVEDLNNLNNPSNKKGNFDEVIDEIQTYADESKLNPDSISGEKIEELEKKFVEAMRQEGVNIPDNGDGSLPSGAEIREAWEVKKDGLIFAKFNERPESVNTKDAMALAERYRARFEEISAKLIKRDQEQLPSQKEVPQGNKVDNNAKENAMKVWSNRFAMTLEALHNLTSEDRTNLLQEYLDNGAGKPKNVIKPMHGRMALKALKLNKQRKIENQ